MPYLNLDIDWFTHRKAIRLVGMLGQGADFLPLKLWTYSAKHHAENGRLCGYSVSEIEHIVGWSGEPGKFVAAMEDPAIKLLEHGENFFQIHDWMDHAGHLAAFKKRAKTAAKKRWSRYATSNAKSDIKQCPSKRLGKAQLGKDSSEEGAGETVLPEWLDPNVWRSYLAHRAAMPKKNRLTKCAEELALKQLSKWKDSGQDPNEILTRSVMNGWVGLFEIKNGGAQPQQEGQLSERTQRILRRGLS